MGNTANKSDVIIEIQRRQRRRKFEQIKNDFVKYYKSSALLFSQRGEIDETQKLHIGFNEPLNEYCLQKKTSLI